MRVIDLSTLSLVGGSGIAEAKILLWSADGMSLGAFLSTSASPGFIGDGVNGGSTGSPTHLFTLSSNWPSSLQYAFEATIDVNNSSATGYAELWDFTSSSAVTSSQVSTASTTLSVIRSSKFTLTPGHVYGVGLWSSSASYGPYISDASLIIFP